MSTELPIACSLSAGELRACQAQIAELVRDAFVEARVEASHADLHFKGAAAVRERVERFIAAGGILMLLCCAVGPAVIGAVAGAAIGGWLGIACAVVLAAGAGLVLHRRARRRGSAC